MKETATILVVEDNPENMILFRCILEGAGYHVVSANNAEEALATLAEIYADLVLMDINLPVVNGIELFQTMQASPQIPAVPVIAITANNIVELREACLEAGFTAYMDKPVLRVELLNTVKTVLNKVRAGISG